MNNSLLKKPTVGVVTVTYNSERFLDMYMRSLESQTHPPDRVILVDSGSPDTAFLESTSRYQVATEVVRERNVGFAAASNIGWRKVRQLDYVLFLNPDAFLTPEFLEKATSYMEVHPEVGMITPTLIRFDIASGQPLDLVDTTGVVRNRMGLLVERDQGKPVKALDRYEGPNEIPWLCAAVTLARDEALEAVVQTGDELFDESFFMYKEDTDLAWRVRRAGWRLMHLPALREFHCRGWQVRRMMPRRMRLLTARNEVMMSLKNRSPFVLVGVAKYLLVLTLNW